MAGGNRRWAGYALLIVGALASCGGREDLGSSASAGADAGVDETCVDCSSWANVVPEGGRQLVDGFAPPTNPPLECDDGTRVSLVLPCELGLAPVHELE